MSEVMLHGVLNMPIDLWGDDEINKHQRHSRYVEASEKIYELEQQTQELLAQNEELLEVVETFIVYSNHSDFCVQQNGHPRPSTDRCKCVKGKAELLLAKSPKQSLACIKSAVERETVDNLTAFLTDAGFKVGDLIKTYYEIHGGKYQPTE